MNLPFRSMSIFRFGQKLSVSAKNFPLLPMNLPLWQKPFRSRKKTIPCGNVALLRMPVCCKLTLL